VISDAVFDPLTATPGRFGNFEAIWDTGATGSVITQKVVDALQISPIGLTMVGGVNSSQLSQEYLVNFVLPSQVGIRAVRVTLGQLPGGLEALIGMDIINLGDLHISNVGGNTVMSFRVPSLEVIDFVKIADAQKRVQNSSPRQGLRPNPKKRKRR
jgi:hypothetical protein